MRYIKHNGVILLITEGTTFQQIAEFLGSIDAAHKWFSYVKNRA